MWWSVACCWRITRRTVSDGSPVAIRPDQHGRKALQTVHQPLLQPPMRANGRTVIAQRLTNLHEEIARFGRSACKIKVS